MGNACDLTPNGDDDSDTIDNLADNCPAIANANQQDTDNDGTGDVCDATPNGDVDPNDLDGDGIPNDSDPSQMEAMLVGYSQMALCLRRRSCCQ